MSTTTRLDIDPLEYLRDELINEADDWHDVIWHAEDATLRVLYREREQWRQSIIAGNCTSKTGIKWIGRLSNAIDRIESERQRMWRSSTKQDRYKLNDERYS